MSACGEAFSAELIIHEAQSKYGDEDEEGDMNEIRLVWMSMGTGTETEIAVVMAMAMAMATLTWMNMLTCPAHWVKGNITFSVFTPYTVSTQYLGMHL